MHRDGACRRSTSGMKIMQTTQKNQLHNSRISRITNIGLVINVILSAVKVIVGWLANSTALIADGIHSLSDITTDAVVLVGVRLGSKKPDAKHPYGHGRIETFAAVLISIVLLLVGIGLVYRASYSIVHHETTPPSVTVMIVAFISIVSKEWLYQATKKVAKETHSAATYANAWHHRSDSLSSVAVLFGVGSMFLGFGYGDEVATISVGIMIALVGFSVLADSISELTEKAVDQTTHEHIKKILASSAGIHQWHKLRTRVVGREVFLDLHILVDPMLNITEAHAIAERLETSLHEQIDRPINITVHVEPDLTESKVKR